MVDGFATANSEISFGQLNAVELMLTANSSSQIGDLLALGIATQSFALRELEPPPVYGEETINTGLIFGELTSFGILTSISEILQVDFLVFPGQQTTSPSVTLGSLLGSGTLLDGEFYLDTTSVFQDFFGARSTQTIDSIVIYKQDIFVSSIDNTAESLFVALLRKVLMDANTLTPFVNVSDWGTYFEEFSGISKRSQVFVVEINVPAKYKYIGVEIINANDSLRPDEL